MRIGARCAVPSDGVVRLVLRENSIFDSVQFFNTSAARVPSDGVVCPALREVGCTTGDPFPLRDAGDYPGEQLVLGALTYRAQCAVCHTVRGANGLTHLMGAWSPEQQRMMVAQLQWTKGFMPPFAGTAEELEALVQYLRWEEARRPAAWPESRDPAVIAQIRSWLDRAGTAAATGSSPPWSDGPQVGGKSTADGGAR